MQRQSYHGKDELVASNAMEIIDAMTVSDHASVRHVIEDDAGAFPSEGLYWRQHFDARTMKLSVSRTNSLTKSSLIFAEASQSM